MRHHHHHIHFRACFPPRGLGFLTSLSRRRPFHSERVYNVVDRFSNRNRSALVRDLLSINSQLVGQLYEDKSLTLRARDLIFFKL